MKRNILLIALLTAAALSCKKPVPREISIIPQPVSIEKKEGYFTLNSKTAIICPDNEKVLKVAEYFAERIRVASGVEMKVTTNDKETAAQTVKLMLYPKPGLAPEEYTLQVGDKSTEIRANTPAGLFYGIQTLLQMMHTDVFGEGAAGKNSLVVPCCIIKDHPRFSWRGMHLDVSRHFFPVDFIKRYIDLIAMHKMNVFHWHLTDDNGWRIEIKKYPLLTEVAAWRVDRESEPWRSRKALEPGEKATYGGFYTQDEIREVVAYAAERFVQVIPEIEMPGHTSEVFAAYPELSCKGEKLFVQPGSYWPNTDIFCAGKEETFEFIENVLTEVIDLFPSAYIHVGGDEADKTRWKECPLCQKRIRDEKLGGEDELQSWFIRRVETFLNSKGRKLIGWDEILEGGLAPDATVMSWRGFEGGAEAAAMGHDVVMCPTSHCYFDYYQADPGFEPEAIGGFTTLKKVYSFEPIPPDVSVDQAIHILGGQGNVWTEYIATPEHAEYMAVPRMTALAEALWSARTRKNWDDFRNRLDVQFERFDFMKVNYSRGSWKVDIKTQKTVDNRISITFETEQTAPEIRYSINDTLLNSKSMLYKGIFAIDSSAVIRAGIFRDGKLMEKVSEKNVIFHKAMGMNTKLEFNPDPLYAGNGSKTLVDGLTGSDDFRDGHWIGFHGTDMNLSLDLGSLTEVHSISINFFQNAGSWIFMPQEVHFRIFDDTQRPVAHITALPETSAEAVGVVTEPMAAEFKGKKARFVHISARKIKTCPKWHEGAGNPAWIFADEVIIK